MIKVIWGSYWDALLSRDTSGKLLQLMNETVDGEYQNCKAKAVSTLAKILWQVPRNGCYGC